MVHRYYVGLMEITGLVFSFCDCMCCYTSSIRPNLFHLYFFNLPSAFIFFSCAVFCWLSILNSLVFSSDYPASKCFVIFVRLICTN